MPKGVLPDGLVVLVQLFFVSVAVWVLDSELKRAGGRALSLSSRPPAVECLRLFFGAARSGAKTDPTIRPDRCREENGFRI